MPRRLLLAFVLLAGPPAASAQALDGRAPVVLGLVDAGTIVASAGLTTGLQRIGDEEATVSPASACPRAKALAPEAAEKLVIAVATKERFFPDFVAAVAKVASRFDSIARSDTGAYGLMRLKPETAQRFGVDLCDPAANVLGGVRYLRYLHERYRNPMFILSAYHAGEARMVESRGIPPIPETVAFVADVLDEFYQWPRPGAARAEARATPPLDPSALRENGAASSRPSGDSADPAWSQGFVRHLE